MTKLPIEILLFVLTVVAVPGVLLVASSSSITWNVYPQLLLFIGAIVGASFLGIQNPAGWVIRATGTVLYAVLYLFNPMTALFIAMAGHIIGSTSARGWVTWRACFNGAQVGLSAALGSLVFRLLGGDLQSDVFAQIVPLVAGPLAYQVSNNFFVGVFFSRVRRVPVLPNWASFLRSVLFSDLMGIPTAALLAILYTRVHYLAGLAVLAVLPFEAWALELYLQRRRVYTRMIETLVRAWEFGSPRSAGHSRRVADLAVRIARELGLVEREVESIEFAALLHDVGMIGLDEDGELTGRPNGKAEGFEAHVRVGAEIARELPRREIAELVLYHHSSYAESIRDGRSTLPLGAQVIALAEDVDSLLNGIYPGGTPLAHDAVVELILRDRGNRFNPEVVDAFVRLTSPETSSELAGTRSEEGATVS